MAWVSCHADAHAGQPGESCERCHSVAGAKFSALGVVTRASDVHPHRGAPETDTAARLGCADMPCGAMVVTMATSGGIVQLTAPELKAMLDRAEPLELIDVRTSAERAVASIPGSRLLDQAFHDELMSRDRDLPLVFQCHHGIRSQAAAEYFLRAGFRTLFNLAGGIDAWSIAVDPSVPRY